ncbi:MAG: hypothetical protein C0601_06310 [Candidatus Muiribacterium halophilum]|uniref:Peptidase M48 domain-containing protein n=1 Tax=Muiribacterium halophilum TaxID=2053465 RepID=A0A2N5ZG03_MUIH1|nr:MAG: hypothetical protein C0601_06310 [Candidatus Muirbacterium halophilum]
MRCTGCGSEKITEVMTKNGVLIDYCEDCKGIWLDKNEIFMFTKSATYLKYHLDKAIKDPRPTERKNPKTGGDLVELSLFGGKLLIDYDPETEGIWLDEGELEALPGYSGGSVNITIDQGTMPEKKDINTISDIKKGRSYRPKLVPLPNLAFTSATTIIGLWGIIGLLFIFLVNMGYMTEGQGLLIYIGFSVLQFILGPFFMDIIQKYLYNVNWVTLDELPAHLREFVIKVSGANSIKTPRFGLIPDGAPNAFTYGHTPNNARIILTEGIIALLEPEEIEGVVAHEIGHAVHWDMLLMTIAQTVPMIAYYLYKTASKMRSRRSKKGDPAAAVAIVSYIVYIISEYVVLWFSRIREYHADRFAGEYQAPKALASALVKIGYGLAGRKSGKKSRDSKLESVKAMGIFDAASARNLAITTTVPSESMGKEVDKGALKGAMRWDLWNPWATYYELHSTHPLIAKRLIALSNQSMHQGKEPYVVFNDRKPESYWDEFFVDLFIEWMPAAVMLMTMTSFTLSDFKASVGGIGLMLFGIASLVKVYFSYPSDLFPELRISSLLKKVKVSHVRGVPVTVKGKIIGKGSPGLIWSEDFILQDETGIIFLDYRQPLRIIDFLFGLLRANDYSGREVVLEGWYRRAPVPYIELKSITTSMRSSTCYVYMFKVIFGIILFVAGLGVLVFA